MKDFISYGLELARKSGYFDLCLTIFLTLNDVFRNIREASIIPFTFALAGVAEFGRRVRLKIGWALPCGFDSLLRHKPRKNAMAFIIHSSLARIAQVAERRHGKAKAPGSSPGPGSK